MNGASKVAQQVGALRSRMFRSFSQRNYRVYFAGHSVSVAGTWMQRIGQDWLLLELTGSPLVLGVALFCQFLPVLLLSPWGGLLVDRTDTRRLLMVTQALQAALAVTLAVVTLTGVATVTWVFLLAIGLGIVSAVDVPARQTFVSELVDDADIVNAQALTGVMHNLGRLLGPALAGVLILLVGVGITFVVNAVSFVAVLVSLTAIDVGRLHAVPVQPRGRGQLREGVAYVWRTPELRATVLIVAIVSLLGQNFRVVFPVLASETFAGDAGTYGVMTSALGIGAVLGSFASAAATRADSWRFLWTCVGFGAANLLVAVSPTLGIALAAIALLGVLNLMLNVLGRAILLVNTAPQMRGRVIAIHSTVFLGATPFGGVAVGALVEVGGPRAGLVLAAASAVVAAAAAFPALRRVRAARAGEPSAVATEQPAG
nr:MFS transporter [uncultured Actinotalea sp.]